MTSRATAVARPKSRRLPLIWIVPLAALTLVGYLIYQEFTSHGPTITITFKTATGIAPDQTEIRYKAVTIGLVKEIELSQDRSHVVVHVRMNGQAESMLNKGSRFWVVRPRLQAGLGAIGDGLQTLISGAYIAMDPGPTSADSKHTTEFTGLEEPPGVRSDQPGTVYVLESDELGKLSSGSPVRYRDIDVGEVLSHELDQQGRGVRIRIFVEAPFDKKIVDATRFWRATGLTIANKADGLNIELQSVRVLLSGGITFDTPQPALKHTPSAPESNFRLHLNEAIAKLDFYSSVPYVSYFQTSIRGLAVGSEVQMFGQRVGAVTGISLVPHEAQGSFAVRVAYVLQPERVFPQDQLSAFDAPNMAQLMQQDMRVVLQTTSFVTGEKILSIDHAPGSPSAPLQKEGDALVLPSESRDIMEVATTLAGIANDVDQIPFEEIGRHLNLALAAIEATVKSPELQHSVQSLDATLTEAKQLVKEARAGMAPALDRLPAIAQKLETAAEHADRLMSEGGLGPDSTVQRNLERMTDRIAEAAESVRDLSDYLHRHPESLIRGRKEGQR